MCPVPPGLVGPSVPALELPDLPRSSSPETSLVHKSECLQSLYSVHRVSERDRSETLPPLWGGRVPHSTGGSRPADRSTARAVAGEPVRPAAQRAQRASSPDRAAGANGGAHRLDRPSEGLVPSQRKADRQSDQRERNERRSL